MWLAHTATAAVLQCKKGADRSQASVEEEVVARAARVAVGEEVVTISEEGHSGEDEPNGDEEGLRRQ